MTTESASPCRDIPAPLFDAYSQNYDAVLNASLAASGETREYFARGRLAYLARRLALHQLEVASVLDYGCGTGASTPLFFEFLHCSNMLGIDVSPASLRVAAHMQRNLAARFASVDQFQPCGDVNLVYSNGVFHHIAPAERPAALARIYSALREGGAFALWENNPWNPGTRYCMRLNPFDRDALAITPLQANRLVRGAGFEILETRYIFFFPRFLRGLRPLEPCLSRLPLGGQYLVLACKPRSGRRGRCRPDQHTRFR